MSETGKPRMSGQRAARPPASSKPPGRGARPPQRGQKIRRFVLRLIEVLAIAGGLLATAVASAAISFTLAVRSNEVTVPDLTGSSIEGAQDVLAGNELSLVLNGNRFHDTVPADFVALQTPAPGTTLKKGRSIRVWVSLGPERRTVPRIEGETLQSAQLILEQGGFSLGRVVEIHSDIYSPDTVVAQSPQAYDEVGDESEVAVLLSRGYVDDAFVMPDFIGRDYADLLLELSRSPLKVDQVRNVRYPGVSKNIVVRQSPSAGSKVRRRDRITLFLSEGR